MFHNEEQLNVISKPIRTFFLAERPGYTRMVHDDVDASNQDSVYTVYEFSVDSSVNDIRVYYNPPLSPTPLVINTILKNDKLYFITEEGEELFGHKEVSPYDYKKSLDYAMNSMQIPDSLSTANGNKYHRIKAIKSFKTSLKINTDTAYFEIDEVGEKTTPDEELSNTEVLKDIDIAPVPKSDSKKRVATKKKTQRVQKKEIK